MRTITLRQALKNTGCKAGDPIEARKAVKALATDTAKLELDHWRMAVDALQKGLPAWKTLDSITFTEGGDAWVKDEAASNPYAGKCWGK